MSDERLAEIRVGIDRPGGMLSEQSQRELLAEVDRLQAALAEAERDRVAVSTVFGSHRCGEQAGRAYVRAAKAEAALARVTAWAEEEDIDIDRALSKHGYRFAQHDARAAIRAVTAGEQTEGGERG